MKKLAFVIICFFINQIVNSQAIAEHYVDGPMIGAVTDSSTSVVFILGKGNQGNIFHVELNRDLDK